MAKVNQLKGGAILSYLQMFLNIIIGLVYTPVMMRLLGQSEYGLYQTVASTISMLSILNLGFNASYIRYYAKYKKEGCETDVHKLNGLFLIIFSVIGCIVLLCGLVLSFNLSWIFDKGLTEAEYQTAKILMLFLTVNLSVTFLATVFTSIISAHEKFVFLKLLGMIRTVLSPFITLPLLIWGFGSIGMVAVTVTLSFLVDFIYCIYAFTKLKTKFVFHGFEKGLFKSLFTYTSFIAINLIVDQINLNIDKLLLGRFKGTQVVAVYSVGYLLYSYYVMFSTSVSGVFTPRIHKIVNNTMGDLPQQRIQLTDLFVKVGRIQFLILGLLASGIVFFGKPFIYFWAGDGYADAYYVALLLIIPATIALTQNLGIEIQRAQNNHQFRSIVYLLMALTNLVLSIFLCQKYGAVGSAIGTAISLILANGLIMNIYYQAKCNINIVSFWKNILRVSLGLIVPIVVGILIVNFINLYSPINLIVFILIYTVIYCISMWFMGMNRYERGLIKKPVLKVLKRNK